MIGSKKLLEHVDRLSRSVSSLQKVFDCPICLDVLDDPVRTTVCGHTFCRKCINQILKSSTPKKLCPLCNAALSHRSIIGDDKTLKFLHLSLELITAISLDTGIDVTEYKRSHESSNEASLDSEEFFKSKKSSINSNKIETSRRRAKIEHDQKPKLSEVNETKNNCNEAIKQKPNNTPLKVKHSLKSYFSSSSNKKIEGDGPDIVPLFKKPYSKHKVNINDSCKNELKNRDKVVSLTNKKYNESCIKISSDCNNVEVTKTSDENVLFSNEGDDLPHGSSTIVVTKDASNSVSSNSSNVISGRDDLNRSLNDDGNNDISDDPLEVDDINCNAILTGNNDISKDAALKVDDINCNAISIGNNDISKDAALKVDDINCNAISTDENIVGKTTDINDSQNGNDKSSHKVNVPFRLVGGLSSLKEIKEMKEKRQNSLRVPFVLFGTLELDGRKRKFDDLVNSDFHLNIDDIRKISLFDFCVNDPSKISYDELQRLRSVRDEVLRGDNLENRHPENSQIYPQVRKKFHPSVPNSKPSSFRNNKETTLEENLRDFSPSLSPVRDYDIFDGDERNLSSENIDELDGLKSISQVPAQTRTSLKDNETEKYNSDVINQFCGSDDNYSDCGSTVINENIFFNKNKLKVCQRAAIGHKSTLDENVCVSQSLSKRKSTSSVVTTGNKQDISVNEIENSEPVNYKRGLSDDIHCKSKKSRANFSESLIKTHKGDVSVDESKKSKPTNEVEEIKKFLNKIDEITSPGLNLHSNRIQDGANDFTEPTMSSREVEAREKSDKEEIAELMNRIKMLERELSAKTDVNKETKQISEVSDSGHQELMLKNSNVDINNKNFENTIIEASDEDNDDSISQTPPSKTTKVSGLEFGGLLSQRIKVQRSSGKNVTIMDSETNEIPSSLDDMNCGKEMTSKLAINAKNFVPSVDEVAADKPAIQTIPDVGETCNLNTVQNFSKEHEKTMCDNDINLNKSGKTGECSRLGDSNDFSAINRSVKSVSFVYSRLTDLQLKELKLFAFHINADITDKIVEGVTTHVIIRREPNNRALHTFKYLKGVACRIWVVSTDWVFDCLKSGRLLPEENYLVLDSSGEPGPLRCRQPDSLPPLKDFIVLPLPPYTSTTIEQVKDLIVLCGGEIVPLQVLSNTNYKKGTPRLLVMDSDTNPEVTIEYWLEKFHLVSLNVEWLLEVVGQYKLVPINSFMIAPYPRQLLNDLNIPDELIVEDDDEDYEEVSIAE